MLVISRRTTEHEILTSLFVWSDILIKPAKKFRSFRCALVRRKYEYRLSVSMTSYFSWHDLCKKWSSVVQNVVVVVVVVVFVIVVVVILLFLFIVFVAISKFVNFYYSIWGKERSETAKKQGYSRCCLDLEIRGKSLQENK